MDPTYQRQVEDRANELFEHTSLSEKEAKVWARRTGEATFGMSVVASGLGIEESTAYEYERRAREKVRRAKATHFLAGEGQKGPRTKDDCELPTAYDTASHEGAEDALLDDPWSAGYDSQSLEHELESCIHWLEMGIEEVQGIDLRAAAEATEVMAVRARDAEEFIEQLDDRIEEASELEERVAVYDHTADSEVQVTSANGRYIIRDPNGREELDSDQMLRLAYDGRLTWPD